MAKKFPALILKNLCQVVMLCFCFAGLLLFPKEASQGIKTGLKTLYETLIPALFPFMILSSYISLSPITYRLSKKVNRISEFLFKINGNALITLLLSFFGGYPVGAKTACELYERKSFSENEINRLFCFCVNPSLPFCVTAVGTFMLKNTLSGVILYVSCVLGGLTLGIILRFTGKKTGVLPAPEKNLSEQNILTESVARGNSSIISVCGWVLVFSCINEVFRAFPLGNKTALFLTCFFEVTVGCREAISQSIPLHLIAALLSFGGLAVIFQVSPYLKKCNISFKQFFCWRVINSLLSGIICFLLVKIFPQALNTSASISIGSSNFALSHSILAGSVCILMCLVFIFEVDNKRKIC